MNSNALPLPEEKMPDFLLTISFEPDIGNPHRIFSIAARLLESLQRCDRMLLKSFPTAIKPVFVLEAVESGSLKMWLKQILEAAPDDALNNLDWRPAIGQYLVKGKYFLLEMLGRCQRLPSSDEIGTITDELYELAKETDVLALPAYSKISGTDIANEALDISRALEELLPGESVSYECDAGDAVIRAGYNVTQEQIDSLLISQKIENTFDIILMVRKPDFLGETRWEFRFEKRNMFAAIADREWLDAFQAAKIDIRPGDALKVKMLEAVFYDGGGEVVRMENVIQKVLEVIRKPSQAALL